MSAIWGAISNNKDALTKYREAMNSSMQEFMLDRVDTVETEKCALACGHQYFTEEAVGDKSPINDEEKGIIFSGDCYLYNREEIYSYIVKSDLDYDVSSLSKLGDVELSYLVYGLYKEEFVDIIQGSFSFSVYDCKNNLLSLYTDHVSQRALFYFKNEEGFFYASVLQPLLAVMGKENIKLNEEWIATAFTDCSADTVKLPCITVFEGINQLAPARRFTVDMETGKAQTTGYWNPVKSVREFKGTDEECRSMFISVFENTTSEMARARKKTAIELSGGLDSATVAAFLARKLQKDNKSLYSYTSVPVKEYEYKNTGLVTENETKYILDQQKMYPNIIPEFVDYGEANAFSNTARYVDLYKQPVKPVINLPLIEEMTKRAVREGCNVIFSGQNGNATISYGRIFTYVYQKLCKWQFGKAFHEMNSFCKKFRLSRKKFIKLYLKSFRNERLSPDYIGDSNFVRDDLMAKYRIKELLKGIQKSRGTGEIDSVKQRRNFCYMPEVFQHMGYYDTYISLKYGVLSLDPTLSKPVIEMCMSMPIDYFVKDGKERRAIRDYMRGYVCDSVLDNYAARGAQAADYSFCVNRDWEHLKDSVYELIENPQLRKYMDDGKLKELVREARASEGNFDGATVAKLAVISSLSIFLNNFS